MMASLHEKVEFEHKPNDPSLTESLRSYMRVMVYENRNEHFRATLILDGKTFFLDHWDDEAKEVEEWCLALLEQLTQAESYTLDFYGWGDLSFFYDNGMWDILKDFEGKEKFNYQFIVEGMPWDASAEFTYMRDGKTCNIASLCEPNIAEKAKGCQFYGDLRSVYADFDHQAHPEIVQQLREAIRAYVTEEHEHQDLEKQWEELEEEGTFGYLFPHNYIGDDGDLSRTQRLVDQINQILAPIAEECTIYNGYPITRGKEGAPDPDKPYLSHCYYDQENFGVAALIWKDHRLQLVGAML